MTKLKPYPFCGSSDVFMCEVTNCCNFCNATKKINGEVEE